MKAALLSLAALLLFPSSSAETVYTTPAGYVTYDLVPGFNVLGINVHNPSLATGSFEMESLTPADGGGNSAFVTLTDDDGNFSTALNEATATYLLEITSGSATGAVAEIASYTETTLRVTSDVLLGAGNAEFVVRKAFNLRDIFGSDGESKLKSSFTSTAADVILVPDGTGSYDRYFYRGSTTNSTLRSVDDPSVVSPAVPVFYPSGLLVQVESTPKSFPVFGEVKMMPTAFQLVSGFNVLTVASPGSQTLSSTGLQNTLQAAFTSTAADILWSPNGDGTYTRYFLRGSTTNNSWRLVDDVSAGDKGSDIVQNGLLIQRSGSSASGLFQLPTNFAQ